ncbi:hypothetical protein BGZ61DRAFT_485556 [Ilyonectria robusta]|uniref:uncharacterized protein n=1 Tax=Ilyonectria robusta TaxID=1079257 RepID=UPI001E8EAD21|nr:uncharacterized protein BGZ61DRAFT_486631 [Ilyonectria robusta]XP_046095969.1 uncharacterized protein BGZ61DRAFT_485556 [Ilyonectria robusta]KAH8656410.1 hypothetical protein BGZ61DRAFT_486631 [Ilyonectria robusta]KAH8660999.1 hypothetical protein BGZ61DRAFT_485556 [Ilyonectria robusta]
MPTASHTLELNTLPSDAEELIDAALSQGRYDCLALLLNKSSPVRKAVTLGNITRTRQSLDQQKDIVQRGDKWTPTKIWGFQIGTDLPNTFNAKDASEVAKLLDEIGRDLKLWAPFRILVKSLKISMFFATGVVMCRGLVVTVSHNCISETDASSATRPAAVRGPRHGARPAQLTTGRAN